MSEEIKRRHIGVIPPHETRHKRYIEEFREVILSSGRIIPHTRFYKISYQRLLQVSEKGASYDLVVASRMRDITNPEINNIYSTTYQIREKLGLPTIFLLSFNELLAATLGTDPKTEKFFIEKLIERENDPGQKSPQGMILTSSTDPNFLVSIIGDILAGPRNYHARQGIHLIENQAHFLNHPPGQTQVGIG